MPSERLGPARLYRRHHLELAEADMTRVSPSICGTMVPKDVGDLQRWARQPPEPLLQSSPDGVILQLLEHLIRADGPAYSLGRNMRVARCRAELGMSQEHLNHPHVRSGLKQMRCKAVAQGVQSSGFVDPVMCLADVNARFSWRGDRAMILGLPGNSHPSGRASRQ